MAEAAAALSQVQRLLSERLAATRLAHGDVPFLPWWLEQVRQHDQRVGRRILTFEMTDGGGRSYWP